KDIFEEAGVNAESIITWDDYIEAGKKIKEKTGTAMLGLELNGHIPLTRSMIHQQDSFDCDDDGQLNAGSEETIRAVNEMKELVDGGITENGNNDNELDDSM